MNGFTALEYDFVALGHHAIAGVDEAGRGPLAGPVVAAAVIFFPDIRLEGVADSKVLTQAKRERLSSDIRTHAQAWGIGSASPAEIDAINILQASILAMHRAIDALHIPADFLLVDGNRFHHPSLPFETVVKGDAHCFSIAAASILAKVERDHIMHDLDARFPQYGFAQHKGYPTKAHVQALRVHGPSSEHRRSFTVKSLDEQTGNTEDEQRTRSRTNG